MCMREYHSKKNEETSNWHDIERVSGQRMPVDPDQIFALKFDVSLDRLSPDKILTDLLDGSLYRISPDLADGLSGAPPPAWLNKCRVRESSSSGQGNVLIGHIRDKSMYCESTEKYCLSCLFRIHFVM